MVTKGVAILFAFVLITVSFVSSVYAADVAYILKDDRFVREEVMGVFSELGLSVEVIEDTQILTKNLANYKLVFVDDAILRKTSKLPVYNYPSVIMNRNYGQEWGLTDDDGISHLASTAPLSVRLVDNGVVQVYTKSKFPSGLAIPYFYLGDLNKAPSFTGIARTYTGNTFNFGDVVSVAEEGARLQNGKTTGGKICFFGIAETKYWTENARDLFKECVGLVAFEVECDNDEDCNDDNEHTEDVCENPGTFDSFCTNEEIECLNDNECGEDGFIGNRFCSGNDVYQDFKEFTCNNEGTVESFCSDGTNAILKEECSDLCLNGECVSVECNNNEDCNDSNERTIDTCINPGTFDSFCTNEEITCLQDSDCGLDGLIGNPFCEENNVFRNFVSHECVNPGTLSSFCASSISQELTQDCNGLTCADGSCVSITCFNDDDCEDGNPYTNDVCHKPGTPQSFCSHGEISCFDNNDCGSNRFLGVLYCSGSDIFRDFVSYECINSGTTSSFCRNNISSIFIDGCDFSCANGDCVRCNDNSDCNDGNEYTQDICYFSGTPESYCNNEHIECFEDSECGENSFVGLPLCIGDDVYQNFREFDCKNPGSVGSYCSSDSEAILVKECPFGCFAGSCLPGIHDVALDDSLSNSFGGIRLEFPNGTDILENPAELFCNQNYKIVVNALNLGDFYENVTFSGSINSLLFSHNPIDNFAPGDESLKTKTVNFSLLEGLYDILIEAMIPVDVDLGNNFASRDIEIICPEVCVDGDKDGFNISNEECGIPDCDDNNPEVNPGAEEICNQIDDDCDLLIDEDGVCCESSTCLIPDNLWNNTNAEIRKGSEKSLSRILEDAGIIVNATADQDNIQTWNFDSDSVTLEITYLGGIAGSTNKFGFYIDNVSNFTILSDLNKGDKKTIIINKNTGSFLGFGIDSKKDGKHYTFVTEHDENYDNKIHAAVYKLCDNTYALGFEDGKELGDKDYNDAIFIIKVLGCS